MSTFTEHRGDTVTTEVRPDAAPEHDRTGHGSRLLITLLVVLAAAVVGLGAWLVIDLTSTPETATTSDIQQLVDEYHAAWNDADGAAYLALVTDDATFWADGESTLATDQAAAIDGLDLLNWHVEQLGDAIMVGDGPWYVAQANRLTADLYPAEGVEGVTMLTIVDVDGTLLVSNHTYVGQS